MKHKMFGIHIPVSATFDTIVTANSPYEALEIVKCQIERGDFAELNDLDDVVFHYENTETEEAVEVAVFNNVTEVKIGPPPKT